MCIAQPAHSHLDLYLRFYITFVRLNSVIGVEELIYMDIFIGFDCTVDGVRTESSLGERLVDIQDARTIAPQPTPP